MFGSKLTRANQREGDGKGVGLGTETGGGGQGPFLLSGAVFLEKVSMTILSLTPSPRKNEFRLLLRLYDFRVSTGKNLPVT